MNQVAHGKTKETAWEPGHAMTPSHYAIVEQSSITEQGQSYWQGHPLPRKPLMSQPEFAHLRDEGPWLVVLGEQPERALATLRQDLDRHSVLGWISSHLSLADLARHLSDALVAQDQDGMTFLLRSYAPHVLRVLHQRRDCAWHAWLFGPITEWSVEDRDGRLHSHAGGGLDTSPEYIPITLDAPLTEALAVDQQALALLTELERAAPEVFTTTCHGERLAHVEQALAEARASGLDHPDDHNLFAALYLLDGQAPSKAPHWPAAMRLVREENYELARALETVQENDLP